MPRGSWTTGTPTARSPRCAATASASSRGTCSTRASPSCSPVSTIAIGTRAGRAHASAARASGLPSRPRRLAARRRRAARARQELPVARPGLGIDVGNPHVVVALADDDELDGLDLAYQPILEPEPDAGANIEFVVPAEPARRRRRRTHPHARPRARLGRDALVRHRRGRVGARRAALGGRRRRRTTGACRCPAACSACACSRPTTASTWRSRVRPSSCSTGC